jgi:formyltetrahydrofolate synthetase
MDYKKILKNVDAIAGLDGVQKLLEAVWCVGSKRDAVLKYIANKYGFIQMSNKEDADKLPVLMDKKEYNFSNQVSLRKEVANKLNVPVSKVKPAGDGFIIRGRKIFPKDILGE